MLLYNRGELIGDGDNGGGVGEDNIYIRRVELVLVLLSDLYSELKISVDNNRSSSCPIYTVY